MPGQSWRSCRCTQRYAAASGAPRVRNPARCAAAAHPQMKAWNIRPGTSCRPHPHRTLRRCPPHACRAQTRCNPWGYYRVRGRYTRYRHRRPGRSRPPLSAGRRSLRASWGRTLLYRRPPWCLGRQNRRAYSPGRCQSPRSSRPVRSPPCCATPQAHLCPPRRLRSYAPSARYGRYAPHPGARRGP